MLATPDAREAFILANTAQMSPPHVPELVLHLADEAHDLWSRTEEELESEGLQPPYWAFAWAGGQGLARHVLDNPAIVSGRTVLDFACGSGLVAIAAARAGAAAVTACDVDAFCEAALRLNARANAVSPAFSCADMIGRDEGWDTVLAGDVFYDAALSARLMPWFRTLRGRGCEILVGDPGRYYLPTSGMEAIATYEVQVTRALEDAEVKRTTVWRIA